MNPLLIVLIGMLVVIGGILALRLNAFLALILGAFVVAGLTPSTGWSFVEEVSMGFGTMCGKIGILIAAASIVGKALLVTGAAERIVRSIQSGFGDRRSSEAFALGGFVVGIPVFFDTVFYLMVPLAKAMASRTGKHYLLYVLSIVAGGTMAHSLVPPTPGPLYVMSELGVDFTTMLIGGFVVGVITVLCGLVYARMADRRWPKSLPEAFEPSETGASLPGSHRVHPPLWLSFVPILLPVALIALAAFWGEEAPALVATLGNKTFAVFLAAAMGLWMIARYSAYGFKNWSEPVREALNDAGTIILVTAAGGALGAALRGTGVAEVFQSSSEGAGVGLLIVAFFVTALTRIAQGSATVAMITAVGIVGPLAEAGLAFHPLYLALAIGCGSKPIPWMNDSGFWIISRMAGTTELETLRSASAMMTLMGVVGLLVVLAGATLLPMIPNGG